MDRNSRYLKQMLFSGIAERGQQLLSESRVLLVGCGALGCVLAETLTRAGIGFLRIVDRDFVEVSNLQRQILFTEHDAAEQLPKAVAAERRLSRVNSDVAREAVVADVDYRNIRQLAEDCDLILDGTDNFEVRYLINDFSLEYGVPWIFTGCTGSHGQMMPVFPGESACLRCLLPEPPPVGSTETCDTAGVLGPAINVIASLQAATALKILTGQQKDVPRALTMVDVWEHSFRTMDVSSLREQGNCRACHHGERLWLQGRQGADSTVLCGRNAVQVTPSEKTMLSTEDLTTRLKTAGTVTSNSFLTRICLRESDIELTVFPDGRAIIRGTEDPATARAIYARYIGS